MTSPVTVPIQRDQSLDLLRIVSICAVVAIHVFGPTAANPSIANGADSWLARVFAIGSIWSVPVFVMLSGTLSLTDRVHRNGPAPFYSRRARRIIPALVFWTVIYLVVIRVLLLGEPMYGWKIVTILVDASAYPHLYFLWLIAGLYLVAPVLHSFLEAGGVRRSVIFAASALALTLAVFMIPGVLALGGVERPITLGALTFWLAYVGYFLTGHALSRIEIGRVWIVLAAVGIPVFGALTILQSAFPARFRLLSAFSPPEYLGTIVALLSICVFVVGIRVLGLVRFGPRLSRWVVSASEASFGVYLVHLVVILVPYDLLPGFHAHESVIEALIAYVTVLVVSFAISLGARRVPVLRAVF